MNTLILSILAGINLAFSLLSLNIWQKNKKQKVYLYFAIFSLFSALYIFLRDASEFLNYRIDGAVILSAAVYYGVFPWFIFEYVKIKQKLIPLISSIIFLIAFILFFFNIPIFNYGKLWHI